MILDMDREKFLELLKMDPHFLDSNGVIEMKRVQDGVVGLKLSKQYDDAWIVTDVHEDPPIISCFINKFGNTEDCEDDEEIDSEEYTEEELENRIEFEEPVAGKHSKEWLEFARYVKGYLNSGILYG